MPTAAIDLDAELKARYDLDGFVAVGRVLEPELLQRFSDRLDAICDGSVPLPRGIINFHAGLAWGPGTGVARRDAVWQILSAHVDDAVVAEVAAAPRILELAEQLLGGRPEVITSQVVAKPARHGAIVPWHQDSSYWGDRRVATCWLAIDDATPENGCMRMIPGSHRQGQQTFTPRRFDGIGQNLLVTDAVAEELELYVPVPAGCATFHSPWTVHASGANTSDKRRRAIAITYGTTGKA
jgi:ectoine hydroxylase-related dioxygenase (phytanoyl-CoA dioxygenase family)